MNLIIFSVVFYFFKDLVELFIDRLIFRMVGSMSIDKVLTDF